MIKLRYDVGDRGRIRKLQGDNHHVNFGAGAKALDVLDELDDFVDVRRVLPLDHDDAQFLERLGGDRTARPDGRRRLRFGRRGWLPGRHLFVAYELERIRRLNPINLLRIEEDGKLRVILDPLCEKTWPSTRLVQARQLAIILEIVCSTLRTLRRTRLVLTRRLAGRTWAGPPLHRVDRPLHNVRIDPLELDYPNRGFGILGVFLDPLDQALDFVEHDLVTRQE